LNTFHPKNKRGTILLKQPTGFTLTELLIAIAITGILSSISLPIYTRQITKTKQSEAAGILTNLQTSIASYVDEYSAHPTQWRDLAKIAVVMTNNGPIQDSDNTGLSTLKTLQNEAYNMSITVDSSNDNHYILTATTIDSSGYNVKACIDVSNGASDLKMGMRDADKEVADCALTCVGASSCTTTASTSATATS
jgi:type IV pilus assembly protein PilA